MKTKKWTIWLASLLVMSLMVTGYFAIAAEYGSKDDPLVTLSYINDVLSPETMTKIDEAFAEKQKTFNAAVDTKLKEATTAMDSKLKDYQTALAAGSVTDEMVNTIADKVMEKLGSSSSPQTPASNQSTWAVVKIPAGATVVCDIGCEIVLRINSATCYASGTPGLVDLSDGTTIDNGAGLVANHLYLVSIKGRGFSSSSGCTVLISGGYTVQ